VDYVGPQSTKCVSLRAHLFRLAPLRNAGSLLAGYEAQWLSVLWFQSGRWL
jgi:hypothetical protein